MAPGNFDAAVAHNVDGKDIKDVTGGGVLVDDVTTTDTRKATVTTASHKTNRNLKFRMPHTDGMR